MIGIVFLVKFRWNVVFRLLPSLRACVQDQQAQMAPFRFRTLNTNNSVILSNNTTSQTLFPACTLCAELECDFLSMMPLSHMNNQLILIDKSKVLRLWRPENSRYIWFYLCSAVTTSNKWALWEVFFMYSYFFRDLAIPVVIFVTVFQATQERAFFSRFFY